jgi:hypothetical protein
MKKQELSNQDLATISGVTYRQVMSWRSGQYPVPMMLSFLLSALDEGLIEQEWLINKLQKELRNRINA